VSNVNMIIRFAIMNVMPFIIPFDRTDDTFCVLCMVIRCKVLTVKSIIEVRAADNVL
jgi:hypothetical protein